jgi:hypothetical protein
MTAAAEATTGQVRRMLFIGRNMYRVPEDAAEKKLNVSPDLFLAMEEVDPATVAAVATSLIRPIEGETMLGLRAKRDLAANTFLGLYRGRWYQDQNGFDTDQKLGPEDLAPYAFTTSTGVVIDGAQGGNETCRINDATVADTAMLGVTPNCEFLEIFCGSELKGVAIVLTKLVLADQELFISYGHRFFSTGPPLPDAQLARECVYTTLMRLGRTTELPLREALFSGHLDRVYARVFPDLRPLTREGDFQVLVEILLRSSKNQPILRVAGDCVRANPGFRVSRKT